MGLREIVQKTIRKKRGYKYSNYSTEYETIEKDGEEHEIFKLIHYGTLILSFDRTENEVLKYRTTSISDKQAINKALRVIPRRGNFHLSNGKIKTKKNGKTVLYEPIFGERKSWTRIEIKGMRKSELKPVERITCEKGVFVVKDDEGNLYGFKADTRHHKNLKVSIPEGGDKEIRLLDREENKIAEGGISKDKIEDMIPHIVAEEI